MQHPALRRAGAVLLAVALVLVGCGDDDDTVAGQGTTSTTTTSTTTTLPDDEGDEAEAPVEDTQPEADGTVIDVTVAGGEVTGGGRHQVDLGETVTIRVTSDVADHIHLHGYDVLADVGAGETAELVFEATIPGVWEVELEDARLPLLELEIS